MELNLAPELYPWVSMIWLQLSGLIIITLGSMGCGETISQKVKKENQASLARELSIEREEQEEHFDSLIEWAESVQARLERLESFPKLVEARGENLTELVNAVDEFLSSESVEAGFSEESYAEAILLEESYSEFIEKTCEAAEQALEENKFQQPVIVTWVENWVADNCLEN